MECIVICFSHSALFKSRMFWCWEYLQMHGMGIKCLQVFENGRCQTKINACEIRSSFGCAYRQNHFLNFLWRCNMMW